MRLALALLAASFVHAAEPLYVFDNGLGRGVISVEAQVGLAKETGYAGVLFAGARNASAMVAAHRAAGLRVLGIYTGVNLSDAKPALEAGLPEAIESLRGTGALITFTINGQPATGGDATAVQAIREVADLAAKAGLRVALYPHYGFYMTRIEDALRLRALASRPNVGLVFNLCHWLRSGDGANLQARVAAAAPHLLLVLINGSDHEGDWTRLIRPLGEGDYDVPGFLKTIRRGGYSGPVGLQCYGIPGERAVNLRRSFEAWRRMKLD